MEEKNTPQELLVVPLALMNDILSYLGTKPYTEVAPYINAIQANSKLVPQPKQGEVVQEAEVIAE
jgi:hypothetical protein